MLKPYLSQPGTRRHSLRWPRRACWAPTRTCAISSACQTGKAATSSSLPPVGPQFKILVKREPKGGTTNNKYPPSNKHGSCQASQLCKTVRSHMRWSLSKPIIQKMNPAPAVHPLHFYDRRVTQETPWNPHDGAGPFLEPSDRGKRPVLPVLAPELNSTRCPKPSD